MGSFGLLVLRERQFETPEGTRPVLSVDRVWVARQERRKGTATEIIRAVEKKFNRPCSELGYQAPFTLDGAAFLENGLGLKHPFTFVDG